MLHLIDFGTGLWSSLTSFWNMLVDVFTAIGDSFNTVSSGVQQVIDVVPVPLQAFAGIVFFFASLALVIKLLPFIG